MCNTAGADRDIMTHALTGHFYLTKLLLPTLLDTIKSSPPGTVRVITTSSIGHIFVDRINYDTTRESGARNKMGSSTLYSQSKFGNVVFANELARRYGDQGLVSMSCNPGERRLFAISAVT